MTAFDLYHDLIGQGFSVFVKFDKILLAPSSRLTDYLRSQIREHKSDLLTLLAANDKEVKPYSHHELISLLTKAAKPLYHHLIDCEQCSLEEARYCVDGFGLGNSFDCLLLCFDDAADKRYRLMNHVIKARIYGRRVFESLESG